MAFEVAFHRFPMEAIEIGPVRLCKLDAAKREALGMLSTVYGTASASTPRSWVKNWHPSPIRQLLRAPCGEHGYLTIKVVP